MWFKMDLIGSKYIELVQTGSNLFKLVQTCSELFKLVQNGLIGSKYLKLA